MGASLFTLMGRYGRHSILLAVAMAIVAMISAQASVSYAVNVISDYGAISTGGLRISWAALMLLVVARPPLSNYSFRQWCSLSLLGTAMAVMTVAFFVAISRLPQHLAVALEFCGPLLVAASAGRRWLAFLWPLLAGVGIVLLVLGDAGSAAGADETGIAFALLAAVGWGGYIVMMKKVGSDFPGLQGLSAATLVAALLALPFAAVESGTLLFPGRQVLLTAGLALLSPLAAYILEMQSLRRLPAASFGVLMSLEPAIAACAGWVLLGQAMEPGQMIGTGLVVVASIGVVRAVR